MVWEALFLYYVISFKYVQFSSRKIAYLLKMRATPHPAPHMQNFGEEERHYLGQQQSFPLMRYREGYSIFR